MSIDPEIQTQTNEPSADESAPDRHAANANNNGGNESGGAKPALSLAAVGVRAAFWTVAAVILLCACILMCSPYTAMRFYSKLDLKDMALYSAEKYLRWHEDKFDPDNNVYPAPDGKYADALYCAANNSIYFMNKFAGKGKYSSRKVQYYARRVDRYAGRYLVCNIPISLYDRTQKIDTYGLQHTSPALHPYVYSFADRLSTEQFKAWYILGENERMTNRWDTATAQWSQEGWEVHESDFLLLAQLTAYINAELDDLGLRELIESKKEGFLMDGDVPGWLSLYGTDKPFDLFVYDKTDVDVNGNYPVDEGQFTRLYSVVSETVLDDGAGTRNNFQDKFAAFLRGNVRQYAKNGPTPDRAEHLKYTYYLKTLTDFWRAMRNMTVVLASQKGYFPHAAQLQAAGEFWFQNSGIPNVYFYMDGYDKGGVTRDNAIYEWYRYGAMVDYLAFYNIYA
ncbi:MAG: hypothetical protein HFE46_00440 [Clostridia bacterium]|nr:hypothetical protein [Clostridia bacterium]